MVMEMIGLLFVEHFNHKSSSSRAYSVNFANGSQKRVSNIITNEIVYTFVKIKQEKKTIFQIMKFSLLLLIVYGRSSSIAGGDRSLRTLTNTECDLKWVFKFSQSMNNMCTF